jgi:TPR repeat protein
MINNYYNANKKLNIRIIALLLLLLLFPSFSFAECNGCEDCPNFSSTPSNDHLSEKIKYISNFKKCSNDKDCIFNKGEKFFYGCGVSRDYKMARIWYKKAAKIGSQKAILKLADMNKSGKGGITNPKNALRAYMSDPLDDGEGFYRAGLMYLQGDGIDKDYKLAKVYLQKATNKNHKFAKNLIYKINEKNINIELSGAQTDLKNAIKGDKSAQREVGYRYLYGFGVKKNIKEALSWFSKAAINADACSFGLMGDIYFEGDGIKEDRALGLTYWKKIN